ncbi:MAG: NADH:quinone oxidoreductase subunit A [Candidatus Westeberhardia cardiocondylae]|nr:NADH:quinone oxidoreductase subunit A [Candidatus Westeberhardia cardiocondylae]
MYNENIISFIIFFVLSLIICLSILVISYFLGERTNKNSLYSKNIPFESGVNPIGDKKLQFSAQFYLIAVAFIIFDIESIYIYAWSIVIKETNWISFIEATFFIINLIIGLLYLIKKNILNWNKKR